MDSRNNALEDAVLTAQKVERRQNDATMISLIQSVVDTNKGLIDKIDETIVKVAKLEVTLDNQVKTIEKYNNFSNRLIHVENTVEFIKNNCANVQKAKEESKKRYQVPWGSIISGVIVGVVVGAFVYMLNHT